MYRQMKKRSVSLGALAATFVICALCLVLVRSVSAKPDGQDENTDQSQNAASNRFLPAGAIGELAKINAEIGQTEENALQLINTNLDFTHQIQTLGKLELFDRTLSVDKNESCSTCHMPEVGYTGESQILNLTTVAYPGSIRSRFSGRKPMSYAYATLAPVLHYNATQHDFYGGNFWDMRATGARLQSPAAEQAQGPPTIPLEMGLPDTAYVAYRVARGRFMSKFDAYLAGTATLTPQEQHGYELFNGQGEVQHLPS
jgi:cytochrome c peroxidase